MVVRRGRGSGGRAVHRRPVSKAAVGQGTTQPFVPDVTELVHTMARLPDARVTMLVKFWPGWTGSVTGRPGCSTTDLAEVPGGRGRLIRAEGRRGDNYRLAACLRRTGSST